MRRLPVAVLVGLLVVVGADAAVQAAAPRLPAPQVWSSEEAQLKVAQMRRLARAGATGGTVFVGSSMMDSAADPARFGDRSYNAALRGAPLAMTSRWTKLVVVPTLRPRRVVLGFNTRELNPNDGAQANSARVFAKAPAVKRLAGTEDWNDRLQRWFSDRVSLVRYRGVLRRPGDLLRRGGGVDGGTRVDRLGMDVEFVGRRYRFDGAARDFFAREPLRDFTVGEAQLRALRSLVRSLTAEGVDVVVVVMPVSADYPDLHPGGEATFRSALDRARRAVDGTGARWVDMGVWSRRYLADPMHVDRAGSRRFVDTLRAELTAPA